MYRSATGLEVLVRASPASGPCCLPSRPRCQCRAAWRTGCRVRAAGTAIRRGAGGAQVGYLYVTDQQRLESIMGCVGWDREERAVISGPGSISSSSS